MASVAYTPGVSQFHIKPVSLDEKNSHIGQDPVFTRGDPDAEENVISVDKDEPLGMPEDMEGADRTPTRAQPMPEGVQGGVSEQGIQHSVQQLRASRRQCEGEDTNKH